MEGQNLMRFSVHFTNAKFEFLFTITHNLDEFVLFECSFVGLESFVELKDAECRSNEVRNDTTSEG